MRRPGVRTAGYFKTAPAKGSDVPVSGPAISSSQPIKVVVSAELFPVADLEQYFTSEAGFVLVLGSASGGGIFLCCEALKPCVLVVDHAALRTIAPEEFKRITDCGRSIQVLVRVAQFQPQLLEELLRLGCAGCLAADFTVAQLKRAVQSVASGELWVSRKQLSAMLRESLYGSDQPRLTAREQEILNLMGRGLSNREIAEGLCISRETVRWHQRGLYAKIGIHDRSRAISLSPQPDASKPAGTEGPLVRPRSAVA